MHRILEIYAYPATAVPRGFDVRLAVWVGGKPFLCVYNGYATVQLFGREFTIPRKVRIWSR